MEANSLNTSSNNNSGSSGTSNNYRIIKELGKGASGLVVLALNTISEEQVAIKQILCKDEYDFNIAMKEAWPLRKLDHESLCSIRDIYFEKINFHGMECYNVNLVMEYYKNGDFSVFLKRRCTKEKQLLNTSEILEFMRQIAEGIDYLHERNLMHRDLKPQNIFVTNENSLKIGDFGLMKEMQKMFTYTVTGTLRYLAPEILNQQPYSFSADIFSMGCIFYEMVTLMLSARNLNVEVFKNKNFKNDLYNQMVNNYPNITSDMAKLIVEMLEVDPKKRPTSKELKQMIRNMIAGKDLFWEESNGNSDESSSSRKRRVAITASKTPLTPIQKLFYSAGVSKIRMDPVMYEDFDGSETNLAAFNIHQDLFQMETNSTILKFDNDYELSWINNYHPQFSNTISSISLNQLFLILTSPTIHSLPLFPQYIHNNKERFMETILFTYPTFTTPQVLLKKCFETLSNIPLQFLEFSIMHEDIDVECEDIWKNDYELQRNEKFTYWKYCNSLGEYKIFCVLEFTIKWIKMRINDWTSAMFDFLHHITKECFDLKGFKSLADSCISLVNLAQQYQKDNETEFEIDRIFVEIIDAFRLEQVSNENEEYHSELRDKRLESPVELMSDHRKFAAPKPIIPMSIFNDNFNWCDIDKIEITRQLTLRDYDYFKDIDPNEFFEWIRCDNNQSSRSILCKGIIEMKLIGTLTTSMFVFSILSQVNIKERKEVLCQVIDLSLELFNLHNFFGVDYVIQALQHPAVKRLEHTWKEIDRKKWQLYEKLIYDMEHHYRKTTVKLSRNDSIIIPIFIEHFKDIRIVESAFENVIQDEQGNQFINWKKASFLYSTVVEPLSCKFYSPLLFQKVFQIQQILKREYIQNFNYSYESFMKDSYSREGSSTPRKDIL